MSETWTEDPGPPQGNVGEYTVSELSFALKRVIESTYSYVRVRGELSGVRRHTSGHVYLDLKDANALISGVIWKSAVPRIKLKAENGLEVVCTGRLTTFPGQSKYQIVIERMELAGLGALMKMLEDRKKKLEAEGLFAASRKKKIPFLPQVIGVVTSPSGAVIRDILHRLRDRFPRHVLVWPVPVQGPNSAAEIANAIRGFCAIKPGGAVPRPDVVIVARGGGSLEDLMPFNEEIVVRAAAACTIPLISAVGHETDTTLIDYAADVRAPTPTAAAEMAVPVRADLLAQTAGLEQRLLRAQARHFESRSTRLRDLSRALPRREDLLALPRQRLDNAGSRLSSGLLTLVQKQSTRLVRAESRLSHRTIEAHVARCFERTQDLAHRADLSVRRHLQSAAATFVNLAKVLEAVSYKATLERGFVLVRGACGRIHHRRAEIVTGEPLALQFSDGAIEAIAEGTLTKPVPKPRRFRSKEPASGQGSLF